MKWYHKKEEFGRALKVFVSSKKKYSALIHSINKINKNRQKKKKFKSIPGCLIKGVYQIYLEEHFQMNKSIYHLKCFSEQLVQKYFQYLVGQLHHNNTRTFNTFLKRILKQGTDPNIIKSNLIKVVINWTSKSTKFSKILFWAVEFMKQVCLFLSCFPSCLFLPI